MFRVTVVLPHIIAQLVKVPLDCPLLGRISARKQVHANERPAAPSSLAARALSILRMHD
ncbi:hypothetical protein RHIZ404_230411 [Rhizobium sp. EC-SD404]|nr:hypothetical protein RHIZ404_230411 [Rhizobium sp. EC-SD404]